jgi:hypothetical protein
LICVWQFGSAQFAGYLTVIHLGSHLNLRRMTFFSFRPLPLLRQGVLRFVLVSHATFFAATSHANLEVAAQIPDARAERAAGRVRAKRPEWAGASC